MSESTKLLQRLISERSEVMRDAISYFVKTISLENRDAKIAAARSCEDAAESLCTILAKNDRPQSILSLKAVLHSYIHQSANDINIGQRTIEALVAILPSINQQEWSFLDQESPAVDFQAVYKDSYDSSRLPDLFEQLIDQLQQIIDSREVDSVRVLEALHTLISTVRRNSRQDVLAAYGTIGFAKTFLNKFLWAVLDEIPAVKVFSKSIRETINELDDEFEVMQARASERVADLVKARMPNGFDYFPKALPPAGEHAVRSSNDTSCHPDTEDGSRDCLV
ncbi:hypothetical protein [Aphanothece minutissima]|uniref:hypothetical protein n=1 Tax=Aphanothece minutissima TaxID=543815 RepID=UPI0011B244F9|nr:hypothetical protein [Aphanothece minutissima]